MLLELGRFSTAKKKENICRLDLHRATVIHYSITTARNNEETIRLLKGISRQQLF